MKKLIQENGKIIVKEASEIDKLIDSFDVLSNNLLIVIARIKKEIQDEKNVSKVKDVDKIVKQLVNNIGDLSNIIKK